MYEPDRYAPWDELDEAARITARRGSIITVHSRAQSAASTSYQPPFGGVAHNLRALKEMIELSRRTGVSMHYSHHIFVGRSTWRTVDESLELIDKVRAEGLDFTYDMYAMTFGVSVITVILPSWYLSLPAHKQKSFAVRARLALEIGVTKRVLGFDFSDIQIAWAGEGHEGLCGKRVTDIAAGWKTSPLSAYLRIVDMSEGKGRVNMYRYYNNDIIQKLMCHEPSLFMTDAWLESCGVQNAAAYGCFPKFLQLSRETQSISMEAAVRKMTGAVADRFGIPNRGYLRKGYAADITVFDPEIIATKGDECTRPSGIDTVLINGMQVVKSGAADAVVLKGAGQIIVNARS
jgi:N-acyl-D-amino-acid deacylase